MSSNQVGGYASMQSDQEYDALNIIVTPGMFIIGILPVPVAAENLGFTEDPFSIGKVYAKTLYALSEEVAEQQPDPDESEYESKLEDSLRLPIKTSVKVLMTLSEAGRMLRSGIPTDVEKHLASKGVWPEDDSSPPALTFQQGQQIPIPWEMIYDGTEVGEIPAWQKFWGFRIPITHWIHQERPKRIGIRRGSFTAINEHLEFTKQESTFVPEQLDAISGLTLVHQNLVDALWDQAAPKLMERFGNDQTQVDDWRGSCPDGMWLGSFFEDLAAESDLEELAVDMWKKKALVAIIQQSVQQDIIHFACHCYPGEAEFLSHLDLQIAGAPIAIEVADLLQNQQPRSSSQPGPLVFLNACGTGQQNSNFERPGFPDKWIKEQGASAVIATICPVPDYFAHAFAKKFYEILFESILNSDDPQCSRNRYIADALLNTRRYFMEEFNNPLGLAYVLYATHQAQLYPEFNN